MKLADLNAKSSNTKLSVENVAETGDDVVRKGLYVKFQPLAHKCFWLMYSYCLASMKLLMIDIEIFQFEEVFNVFFLEAKKDTCIIHCDGTSYCS